MDPSARYEVVDQIAAGDFASVYRARDRELGREVAVKQIHPQFLADPRQLARYWQEAQLLATLQHPNILTIYDIVRPRGWLILELMHGSLKQATQGEPIDLDFLRVTLAGCLQALQFLHANGVIHGDVKPSNILVGPHNRVKLGDFGLARRASNEGGSLLKGTTKYMAPELLSAQFGSVGPASDLYSLGFSAYELMCGNQFDSLLPGLATFGRDRQIAWMMWHSTADARLPEIHRILEGVPEDLARVVQRMIAKDQSHRYRSAQEALRDLQPNMPASELLPEAPDPVAVEAEARAARRKRRLRYGAIMAMVFSVMLSIGIVMRPKKPAPKPKGPPPAVEGVLSNDPYPGETLLGVKVDETRVEKVELTKNHRVFINDEPRLLADLKQHDKVVAQKKRDEKSNQWMWEVRAFRPTMHKGRIQSVQPDESTFVLAIEEGEKADKPLPIVVPKDLKILFNEKADYQGKAIQLADLRPGDRVAVHHIGEPSGRKATEMSVFRVVDLAGTVADDFDVKKGLLSIVTKAADKPTVVKMPVADPCLITINGQTIGKPASLRRGDRVAVKHDTRIVEIRADRTVEAAGVIQQIRYEPPQTLSVAGDGGQRATYVVGPDCPVTLGGEKVALDALRAGDQIRVTHRAIEPKEDDAVPVLSVAATRAAETGRWAILVAVENYEDKSLPQINHALKDAKLLEEVLRGRYQVAADHLLVLNDESLVRLEQSIPERLKQIGADGRVVVYFIGHACKDPQGTVYLAPKNFDQKRPAVTGLALQWLVDQMEECPAKEKLLLLDASHGTGAELAAVEPSSAEMLRSLKTPPGRAPLRTVFAVTSCKAGQRGQVWASKGHGLFAWSLAEAYRGQGDTNRDLRLEPAELFGFLQRAMAQPGSELAAAQSPELFVPDDRPPRLSEDARTAIRRLAAHLAQTKIDMDLAGTEYAEAARLAGKEIEPRLLMGLILLKNHDWDVVLRLFQEIRTEHAALLLPIRAVAWARFEKGAYPAAVNDLTELIQKIPRPKAPQGSYSAEAQDIFSWAGQLRFYAGKVVLDPNHALTEPIAALDAAVVAHGPGAVALFEQGQNRSKTVADKFDEEIANAEDEATARLRAIARRRLVHYTSFPVNKYVQQILSRLDQ